MTFSCCPKQSCKWLPSCSSSLYSICSCFCFKFTRKRKKIIPAFFPFPLHLCFLSISLQESICSGTTTPQEPLCGAVSPTRTILWRVITYKDNFCERQPSPIWSTYFSDDWPLFANTNVIVLSCCVFLCSLDFRYEQIWKETPRCTQEGGEFKSFSGEA